MSVVYKLPTQGGTINEKHDRDVANRKDLPELPQHLLGPIFARLSVAEKQLALRHKVLPVAWLPERILFAAVDGESVAS